MTIKRLVLVLLFFAITGSIVMVVVRDHLPRVIRKSVAITQSVDNRNATRVCDALTLNVQQSTPRHSCMLKKAERVRGDADINNNCVDGVSEFGCFSCSYECRWILPKIFDKIHL